MYKKFFYEALIAIFIVIISLELIGFFAGNNDYFWENRQVLVPSDVIRKLDNKGFWTYRPNISVDSSATYYFSNRNGWLEYRCKFKTNKFGLVDTNYDNQKQVDLLVLGDSFLEGQGGCPWLVREKIAEKDYSKIIINGGLYGTGIENFLLLFNWLEPQVKIKNLMIVAISNDFKRELNPDWIKGNLLKEKGDLIFRANDAELLKIGGEFYRSASKKIVTKLDDNLRYYSTTYRLFRKLFLAFSADKKGQNNSAAFEKNFSALRELRRKNPGLKIILIPQRDEVGLLGLKNLDSKIVEKFLKDEGFKFSRCELDLSDYLKVDGHPNKQGYAKISQCLFEQI